MKLHRVTFALCYYLGLYPFRYNGNDDDTSTILSTASKPFHLTSLGILFKSSNVAFLLSQLVYRLINFLNGFDGSDYIMKINQIPNPKWIDLLPYWQQMRHVFAVYCLIWMTTCERIRFCNNSFRQFTSVTDTGSHFLLQGGLNLFIYFAFSYNFTRLTGTACYFETFTEFHSDLIFVAFEWLILFVLNGAKATLNDIEHRLRSIQTRNVNQSQLLPCLTNEERQRISFARILHFECASVVENLINEYQFLLLFVIADNYIILVSHSYKVALIVYLQLRGKKSNDLYLCLTSVLYIITKIIRLWSLCEADNLLNEQVKGILYILQKLTLNPYQISLDNFKEVEIYQYQCSVNPVKLTVVGLFNLDTNFLQAFLGAALAYVVLMMQSSHVDVTRDTSSTFIFEENATTTNIPEFYISSPSPYRTTI